jgi:transposase
MPRRLQLAAHLPDEELRSRYRRATRPVERAHWQVLWMLSQGFFSEDIADAVGYRPAWVRKLIGRYNDEGPAAMHDGRADNPGAAPLLSFQDEADLAEALKHAPAEGDAWSGPLVARWMSERLGRPVDRKRGWEMLRWLGYTPQRPRPHHTEADEKAQVAFKSGSAEDARQGAAGPPRGGGPALGRG